MPNEMEVSEPWFSLIRNGTKTVEGRKRSPKWKWIQPGVDILVECGQESFKFHVTYINQWDTIRDYLQGEGLAHTLPGIDSVEEGEKIYLQWSTLEEVRQYGFMGIHGQVIDD
jgi:ASC-1-like (ASCH) protein